VRKKPAQQGLAELFSLLRLPAPFVIRQNAAGSHQ
jgi:hypothetical protein